MLFLSNFNYDIFSIENECLIRDSYIKMFMNTALKKKNMIGPE